MGWGRLVLAALVAIGVPVATWAAGCRADTVFLKGDWGQARFSIELADEASERARGLMFVPSMPRSAGMLFVYPRPQAVAFWMRNTLIPLDMIFMDETGTVQRIHSNAVPGDETPIPGGSAIRFVLEVNGGVADQLGLTPGSVMRHPSVAQNIAAWGC
ncbi:hypothetical protein SAMN06265173_11953 [Thalassovita litoralis]|jgi:hypothetical protein|uniref:DUF192 domain-containing protein n=1 Tax=Thalassovita litoralis TaxID=1010611 RepID=A0A521ETL2_9RHOB|nr:hypothetical protein SAMN06265173_11953 [Thalassovita litoralis]